MNIDRAVLIVKQLNSNTFSDNEKAEAISEVSRSTAVNWVSKDDLLNAVRWLLMEPKWTPTKNKKPHDAVLVTDGKDIWIDKLVDDKWMKNVNPLQTMWMDLPTL